MRARLALVFLMAALVALGGLGALVSAQSVSSVVAYNTNDVPQEVFKPGETVRIKAEISGLSPTKVNVTIRYPNGSAAVTNASMTSAGGGWYSYDWAIPSTAPEGDYSVEIYATDGGTEILDKTTGANLFRVEAPWAIEDFDLKVPTPDGYVSPIDDIVIVYHPEERSGGTDAKISFTLNIGYYGSGNVFAGVKVGSESWVTNIGSFDGTSENSKYFSATITISDENHFPVGQGKIIIEVEDSSANVLFTKEYDVVFYPAHIIPASLDLDAASSSKTFFYLGYTGASISNTVTLTITGAAPSVNNIPFYPLFYFKNVDTGRTYWLIKDPDDISLQFLSSGVDATVTLPETVLLDDQWSPELPPPGDYEVYVKWLNGEDYYRLLAGEYDKLEFRGIDNDWSEADGSDVYALFANVTLVPHVYTTTWLTDENGATITDAVVSPDLMAHVQFKTEYSNAKFQQSYSPTFEVKVEDSDRTYYESDPFTVLITYKQGGNTIDKVVSLAPVDLYADGLTKTPEIKLYVKLTNGTFVALSSSLHDFGSPTLRFYHYVVRFVKDGVSYAPANANLTIYVEGEKAGEIEVDDLSEVDVYAGASVSFELEVYDYRGNVIESGTASAVGERGETTYVDIVVGGAPEFASNYNYLPEGYTGLARFHITAQLEAGKTYTLVSHAEPKEPAFCSEVSVSISGWSGSDPWTATIKPTADGTYTFSWSVNITEAFDDGDKVAEILYAGDKVAEAVAKIVPDIVVVSGEKSGGYYVITLTPSSVSWGTMKSAQLSYTISGGSDVVVSTENLNHIGGNSYELIDPSKPAWIKLDIAWQTESRKVTVEYKYSVELDTDTTASITKSVVIEFPSETLVSGIPATKVVIIAATVVLVVLAAYALYGRET